MLLLPKDIFANTLNAKLTSVYYLVWSLLGHICKFVHGCWWVFCKMTSYSHSTYPTPVQRMITPFIRPSNRKSVSEKKMQTNVSVNRLKLCSRWCGRRFRMNARTNIYIHCRIDQTPPSVHINANPLKQSFVCLSLSQSLDFINQMCVEFSFLFANCWSPMK